MGSVATVLTLDISGSRTFLALLRTDGLMSKVREVRNPTGEAETYWPAVLAAASEVAGGVAGGPAAVGVSFGGPVDNEGRVVSIHVGGWAGIDLAGSLAEHLGRLVAVENDANCGAHGEHRYGAWNRPHTLVFLTCSTGIGGGIVTAGRLLKGARGVAGEVGHIPIAPDGPPCPCGSRGCLETMCSGTAIARRATAGIRAPRERRSILCNALIDGEIRGAKPVFEAAAAGDPLAIEVLDGVFRDFGRGIAAIHNTFDPDVIVIGGGVSLAGRALTEPVAKAARPWIMEHRRDHLRLETASLGLHAQLYGAGAVAFEALRDNA